MDEFGVLTERYGLKPQGKSAPMATSKRSVNTNNSQTWNFGSDSGGLNPKSSSYLSRSSQQNGLYDRSDDYDNIFGGPTKQSGNSSFGYDSIFSDSNPNDDIFGGIPGFKSSTSANNDLGNDDIFGVFASRPNRSAPVDDLLGDFGGAHAKSKATPNGLKSGNAVKNASSLDDLMTGIGGINLPNNGTVSTFTTSEDPFSIFESTSTSKPVYTSSNSPADPLDQINKLKNSGGAKPPRLKSPPKATQVSNGYKGKSSGMSFIDELEDFAMGRVQNNANKRSNVRSSGEGVQTSANRTSKSSGDDLESFFSMSSRPKSAPRSRPTTSDSAWTNNRASPGPGLPQRTSSGRSSSVKKSSSPAGANVFGEFHEVEGESEERRRARLGRLQRTHERAAKAVADMNQRDRLSQNEQEERRRIAETMDIQIKRWAAGKEGNMRALLSSLHYVLWPECGWEPVSLTDLITSVSVKKAYRKATLCVHPDKVQQKGASLEQKYTAEKVFDILKEAWNKFNVEELR
ncbi:hypothetical protein FEM48_Zijuj06G0131300 [Ziziphus jujuba var. spinosa]|uniref:J domain-containing protein n=1 Tax=Ziziphus jujuba var. spinosa TaxID=714518 RepID=A0A978V9G5_ZIZJJ|nr:hypothetical protein FEM48_Zijuj06G0131300 [Ziziphus jujuba var. spinosa]